MKHALAALLLALSLVQAVAQAPPPVPALPDTERRTSYSISATTCACNVGFQLYGDSTDVDAWVSVWINGVQRLSTDPTYGWAITSPTGPLATIPRPVTNAILTFNAAQTGTIQIVGARRPRRAAQYSENRGVAARDLNQTLTDTIATQREIWDFTARVPRVPPGETMAMLPVQAGRQNMGACFDSSGNLAPCTGFSAGTFAAGNGIAFTGTNPTTLSSNLTSGLGITVTGTNPLSIGTNIAGGTGITVGVTNPLTISQTPYTAAFTGGVARTLADKLGDTIEAKDFGVVCDNSTDTRANLQKAIDAAVAIHGRLRISAQNTTAATPYCVVGRNGSNDYALTANGPFELVCDKGVAIKPSAAVLSTVSVLYLYGAAIGLNVPTVIDGCFIGDPSVATRNGLHGIVFDTFTAGNYFRGPVVKSVYIQAGSSGNGYGILVRNDVAQNVNGGTYQADFGANSIIQGGINLFGAGDSITLRGLVPQNGAVGADNNGILIALVPGAARAGNITLENINFSQAKGVKIDCAYNAIIRGGEYEGQATLTGNAVIDLNGSVCTNNSVVITEAQLQYGAGFGTPLLLRITVNNGQVVVEKNAFALPTSYTGVSNASTTLQLGPNYWSTGSPHISGTAAANTYGGG